MSRDILFETYSNEVSPFLHATDLVAASGKIPEVNAPSVYRMRCPSCHKLYTVQGEVLRNAGSPLKFLCSNERAAQGCGARFSAVLEGQSGALSNDTGGTFGNDLVGELAAAQGAEEIVVTTEIADTPEVAIPEPLPAAPARVAALKAPKVSELRCPKCGSRNVLSAVECRFCGVVFAKAKPSTEGSGELETRPELVTQWESVLADYENLPKHEAFISACGKFGMLAFAGQKYARILSAAPQEEIARSMRDRVVALVTHRAEPRGSAPAWQFRVPGFNNLILAFGSGLMVIGLMLPNMQHLAGLGFAAIALAVGVRVILRPLP